MVKAQVGACGAFFRKSTKCRVLTIKRALSLLAEPFRKEKPLPVFSTSGGHQLIQGAVRGGNPSPITPNIGGIAGIASRTPAGGLVDRNRLEPWPAATSGSKQRHAQSFSGSDEVLVEGGERQFPALREFQIGSVVQGEPVAFSEPGRGGPCPVSGFRIQRDGQAAQKARKALPPFRVKAPSAFGHQKPVQGLQRP